MQPNDQQGFYQPDQDQPGQPTSLPQVDGNVQSSIVDPAALQAALDEPSVNQSAPPSLPTVESQPNPDSDPEDDDEYYDEEEPSSEPVTWTAQEYIHHEKGAGWFSLFAAVIVILGGISVWTQAWSFTVLIVVIAFVIVVYSRRPPHELTYTIDDDGLTIDSTLHNFDNFKSFGIIRDGEEFSVMLIPTQRFQPGITVYFPEESGEAIVDMLGSRLPMKELHLDMIDRIVRMLRL
ncbi:MAG: hypothetical protein H6797_05800 [Candidatus Nomurabacteria bacterium]|nr:MAG: hypothetical protein H6797_05800 [Candidatus Nomurabacteria bacterium]